MQLARRNIILYIQLWSTLSCRHGRAIGVAFKIVTSTWGRVYQIPLNLDGTHFARGKCIGAIEAIEVIVSFVDYVQEQLSVVQFQD